MLMMLMMITNVIDRQWTVVAGVSGLWSLVSGLWSLVSGLWWSVVVCAFALESVRDAFSKAGTV